jgi:hypothetical protein
MKGKKRIPILSDQRHTYGTPAPGTFIWYFFWENEEEKTLIPLFSRGGRGGDVSSTDETSPTGG